jgi:hypothetical protein
MSHDPTPQKELKAALVMFKAVLDLLPQLTAPRPAFPMIVSPCSGDTVDAGSINVLVRTNQPSILHRVVLLDADGNAVPGSSEVLVTFGPDPADPTKLIGTAHNIVIPAASGAEPATDFLLRCRPDNGDDHRVLITRRSTLPQMPFSVAIDFGAVIPPYEVGQVITFDAVIAGGTPPYRITWDFGDGVLATGTPVDHAYTVPAGARTVWVTVVDASLPSPQSTPGSFGPFEVLEAGN